MKPPRQSCVSSSSIDNMILTKIALNIKKICNISKQSNKSFQNSYNKSFYQIDFGSLICPYCHKSCWKYHASYTRTFILNGITFKITVRRIMCCECHRTHSILPDFSIPYVRHSYDDIVNALTHPDESSLEDSHLSSWKNIFSYFNNPSHLSLCIRSKRSYACVVLLSHSFFAFISDNSYNLTENTE